MRPYQDRPQYVPILNFADTFILRPRLSIPSTQLAFILNLDQHWFTLRRFGHAEPNIDVDFGNGHWFNLNSSLDAPEWVGKTYLGMVLQQAESDGNQNNLPPGRKLITLDFSQATPSSQLPKPIHQHPLPCLAQQQMKSPQPFPNLHVLAAHY